MASPTRPSRPARLTAASLLLACSAGDDGRDTMGSATALTEVTTTGAMTDSDATSTTNGGSVGESESQGTTDSSTTSKVSDSDSDTAATDPTTTTTTDPTDTDTTDDPPCDGGGGGEFSYLWVSNTDQGSVSRVNTLTLAEEARFWSDPAQSGAADPSRTSVNIDGRFMVVANRGAGTVTKIAANVADCIDRNGNGAIETSPNKDTLLNYADEECILWTTKINDPFSVGAGPRGTTFGLPTFNPKTCEYEDEKVWVGTLSAPGQAQMTRINSYTGEIEATVPLPGWPVNIDGINGYAPYGAAIDPDGAVWTTAVFTNVAYRVDPVTLEVQRWDSPNADSHYGMGIDSNGRVWFANWQGHGGVSVFDPKSESWGVVVGSENNLFRGVATDNAGNVWVSANPGGVQGCGLIQVNGDTQTVVQFHTFDQCSTPLGIGFDLENKLWLVDYAGWAYQMDPITLEKKLLPIANVHYTYSDITGSGLAGIKPG